MENVSGRIYTYYNLKINIKMFNRTDNDIQENATNQNDTRRQVRKLWRPAEQDVASQPMNSDIWLLYSWMLFFYVLFCSMSVLLSVILMSVILHRFILLKFCLTLVFLITFCIVLSKLIVILCNLLSHSVKWHVILLSNRKSVKIIKNAMCCCLKDRLIIVKLLQYTILIFDIDLCKQ
jgi:hypothetical protein